MSKVERPGRFRGDLWFQERVAERTRAALKEAHERFEAEHKKDSDEMLIEYVRKCAKELGHTPNAQEIIGGRFIEHRFRGWWNVVYAAGLRLPNRPPAPTHRAIYKQEFARQSKLFSKERKAEKATKEELTKEKRTQAENCTPQEAQDAAWVREHRDDTDEQLLNHLRQRAAELGRPPNRREVTGGTYIRDRFVSWPIALTCAELPLPEGMSPPADSDWDKYHRKQKQYAAAAKQDGGTSDQ